MHVVAYATNACTITCAGNLGGIPCAGDFNVIASATKPGIIFRIRQRTAGFPRRLHTGNTPHRANILLDKTRLFPPF